MENENTAVETIETTQPAEQPTNDNLDALSIEELESRINTEAEAWESEQEQESSRTAGDVLGIQSSEDNQQADDGPEDADTDTEASEHPAQDNAKTAYDRIEDDPRFQATFDRVLGEKLRKEREKNSEAAEYIRILKMKDPEITPEKLRRQIVDEMADEAGLDPKALQMIERITGTHIGTQSDPEKQTEQPAAEEQTQQQPKGNGLLDAMMPTLQEMMDEGLLKNGDVEAIGKQNPEIMRRLSDGENPRKVLTQQLIARRTQEAADAAKSQITQRNNRVPPPVKSAAISGRVNINNLTREQMDRLEEAAMRGDRISFD